MVIWVTEHRRELLERRWRVGGHWGLTIVAEGHGDPDEEGRRDGDELVGMVLSKPLAERVVRDHNLILTWGTRTG